MGMLRPHDFGGDPAAAGRKGAAKRNQNTTLEQRRAWGAKGAAKSAATRARMWDQIRKLKAKGKL